MNLSTIIKTGHFTKVFDSQRRIPQSTFDELLDLLHSSPSSVNCQPWHFVVAASSEGKARILKGVQDDFDFNVPKIMNASHVIVFCTRSSLPEQYLEGLLDQEERAGRFQTEGAKAYWRDTVRGWINLYQFDIKDLQHWMEKQTYLALGIVLLAAAEVGVDVIPMEGFDPKKLDVELNLRERGLTSTVLLGLGYRSADDHNAKLPKSRLPKEEVSTFLS